MNTYISLTVNELLLHIYVYIQSTRISPLPTPLRKGGNIYVMEKSISSLT